VVFGVRGDVNVDVTVYGAKRPLHSGHYGNWAPNPAMVLAHLLASMKDDAGRVSITGWYDGVEPLGGSRAKGDRRKPRPMTTNCDHKLGFRAAGREAERVCSN